MFDFSLSSEEPSNFVPAREARANADANSLAPTCATSSFGVF
jgi:hypothetical protein